MQSPPVPPLDGTQGYGWDKLKSTFEDMKILMDTESERIDRIKTRVCVQLFFFENRRRRLRIAENK